jgi:hypothetical protein
VVRPPMSIASIILMSLGVLATLAQAFFAYVWTETDVQAQFLRIFRDFYPEVPPWTQRMFGLGLWVWLLPAISVVILFLGFRRRSWPALALALVLVTALLGAMFYAMYPIHLMMKLDI